MAQAGTSPLSSRWTPADLGAYSQAWILLLVADLGLRTLPFARLDRWLAPVVKGEADEAAVGRLVWATAAAARHHFYPMRCLPQALCLRRLLGRHGIAAELKIGVARTDGALAAHAWVERDGRPVGESLSVEERFAALAGQGVRPTGRSL
jgi:hypothetical protein